MRVGVLGNTFTPDTGYTVGTVTKLKPKTTYRFSLSGAGNVGTGNIEINPSGSLGIRVSATPSYYSTTIVYFSDDI